MIAPSDAWRVFWAKTDRQEHSTWIHPLWAHLLDVGHTALILWERHVPDSLQYQLATTLGLSVRETGHLLSLWIGLHDIGKAIPTFQGMHDSSRHSLIARGLSFTEAQTRKHHGHASIGIITQWLDARKSPEKDLLEHVAAFVGFHHGRLYAKSSWQRDATNPNIMGDTRWRDARFELLDEVTKIWRKAYPFPDLSPGRDTLPTWLPGFAGWTTLADWLGSMSECFPDDVDASDIGPADYLAGSRRGAAKALLKAGFGQPAPIITHDFARLFPKIPSPRPLQVTMGQLPASPSGEATLTLIEAPTGEGKTEAAFVLAARQQAARTQGGGIYIAMPTQATSNGLFTRTMAFLDRAIAPDTVANFRLVHGNADLHEGQEALWIDARMLRHLFDEEETRGPAERVRTMRWFLNRKRALLATYGLGTVDQAFLGVLYARHFFLRLFALAGKTVIFDEIHAYDVYMSRLFRRLLAWLRALDTHVILLSATLPAGLRNELISAWGAKPPVEHAADVPYPAVWSVSGGQCHRLTDGLTPAWGQQARLTRHDTDPEAIAVSVVAALEAGATVGVICNTVNRAQKVYLAIRERLPDGMTEEDVLLFHARYLFHARQSRETRAGERFGKTRPDVHPAVLVATQVAEQSLDLDFDVLFTDIAPIDLLLQRAGRLHRHTRRRPEAFAVPTLYWHCPEADEDALPDLTEVGVRTGEYSVYEPLIVWKTWRVLCERVGWALPADYRALIEAVYDADLATPAGLSADARQAWAKGQKRLQGNTSRASTHAKERMVPEPTEDGMWDLLLLSEPTLADPEDEEAHASRKALTRDGEESIEAIALYRDASGKLYLDPACTRPALRMQKEGEAGIPLEVVRALLDNVIRISYQGIAKALREPLDTTILEWWQSRTAETPALLYRYPLVLDNRAWAGGGYLVREDDELGLIISRK